MDVASEVRIIADKYLEKVKTSGPDQIMALCPFHDNRNSPSFTMSLTKGLYHCFSCHESGNLQMFLKNVGVTWNIVQRQYRDLIEETRSRSPRSNGVRDPRQSIGEENRPLPEWLLGLFDRITPDRWAVEEGLDPTLLKKMDIGVDEKHQRLTFPLRDLSGALVGISGRDYTESAYSKYKVYDFEYKDFELPEHKTYKSHLLWNGHAVYPLLHYEPRSVVIGVEGFKACMKVVQAGAFNTVAFIGNRASEQQIWQIERMAGAVWLWFDNHGPGIRGTVLSGMRFGIPVRVVPYPDERQQPSDLSVGEIQLALTRSKDFTRWLLDTPEAMTVYQERRRSRQQET